MSGSTKRTTADRRHWVFMVRWQRRILAAQQRPVGDPYRPVIFTPEAAQFGGTNQ